LSVSAAAKSAGVACDTLHVEHDHIYEAIIDVASARRCDLIVMASHGCRGVSAVVLGSETVKVLTHSKTPVQQYPGSQYPNSFSSLRHFAAQFAP
jgi:nucleotide-binding universal stress UspA family protein